MESKSSMTTDFVANLEGIAKLSTRLLSEYRPIGKLSIPIGHKLSVKDSLHAYALSGGSVRVSKHGVAHASLPPVQTEDEVLDLSLDTMRPNVLCVASASGSVIVYELVHVEGSKKMEYKVLFSHIFQAPNLPHRVLLRNGRLYLGTKNGALRIYNVPTDLPRALDTVEQESLVFTCPIDTSSVDVPKAIFDISVTSDGRRCCALTASGLVGICDISGDSIELAMTIRVSEKPTRTMMAQLIDASFLLVTYQFNTILSVIDLRTQTIAKTLNISIPGVQQLAAVGMMDDHQAVFTLSMINHPTMFLVIVGNEESGFLGDIITLMSPPNVVDTAITTSILPDGKVGLKMLLWTMKGIVMNSMRVRVRTIPPAIPQPPAPTLPPPDKKEEFSLSFSLGSSLSESGANMKESFPKDEISEGSAMNGGVKDYDGSSESQLKSPVVLSEADLLSETPKKEEETLPQEDDEEENEDQDKGEEEEEEEEEEEGEREEMDDEDKETRKYDDDKEYGMEETESASTKSTEWSHEANESTSSVDGRSSLSGFSRVGLGVEEMCARTEEIVSGQLASNTRELIDVLKEERAHMLQMQMALLDNVAKGVAESIPFSLHKVVEDVVGKRVTEPLRKITSELEMLRKGMEVRDKRLLEDISEVMRRNLTQHAGSIVKKEIDRSVAVFEKKSTELASGMHKLESQLESLSVALSSGVHIDQTEQWKQRVEEGEFIEALRMVLDMKNMETLNEFLSVVRPTDVQGPGFFRDEALILSTTQQLAWGLQNDSFARDRLHWLASVISVLIGNCRADVARDVLQLVRKRIEGIDTSGWDRVDQSAYQMVHRSTQSF